MPKLSTSPATACAAILMAMMTLALTACGREDRQPLPQQTLHAYGRTWTYAKVEIRKTYTGLFSGHGLFGQRNAYRETHTLTDDAGKVIEVPERLFALQRDGRYQKITCCEYFRERADLYAIDGRLVLVFANARRFITDCVIYPPGHPADEREPDPGKRHNYSTVYAEFDPASQTFKVDQFQAGLPDGSVKAEEQRLGRQLSIAEHEALSYRHRSPFQCDKG